MPAAARRDVIEQAAADVFGERGYHGASIEEIARRSGVSPPVVYDHFESKEALHIALLERHYADLRRVWRENLAGDDPQDVRIHRAFDAWFGYVEAHPFAGRMLFRDTTGIRQISAAHRDIEMRSRSAVIDVLAAESGGEGEALEMAWETIRGALQALALWWSEHPRVPRSDVVATAMNSIWIGFERAARGEVWMPGVRPAASRKRLRR